MILESLHEHKKEWMNLIYGSKETDTFIAEHYVRQLYKDAGLVKPKIIWFDSPKLFVDGILLLKLVEDLKPVRHHLIGRRLHSFFDHLNLLNKNEFVTRTKLEVSVPLKRISENYLKLFRENAKKEFTYQFESPWIADVDYLSRNVAGVNQDELQSMIQVFRNVNIWYPCERVCFLLKRQTYCCLRGEEFHNEDREVLGFADGEKIYALNNAVVPEWVVKSLSMLSSDCNLKQGKLSSSYGLPNDQQDSVFETGDGRSQNQDVT